MRKPLLNVATLLLCLQYGGLNLCIAQQDALQHQNQAASLLLNTEYEAAISQLELAANLYKEDDQWSHYFSCLNQITNTYLKLRKFDRAKKMAKQALWESILQVGKNNDESAKAAHQLAEVYSQADRFTKAEEFHLMGLKIRTTLYGEKHPDIADSYRKLAINYQRQSNLAKAKDYYKSAFELNEMLFGKIHPSTAICMMDLGELASMNERYEESTELYRDALKVLQDALGEHHPQVAQCLHKLSLLQTKAGNVDEAAAYLKEAAIICNSINAEGTLDEANILLKYTHHLFHNGLIFDALPYVLKASQIYRKSEIISYRAGEAYYLLALIQFYTDQLPKAVEYFKLSITTHYQNPLSYSYLIRSLLDLEHYKEAQNWAKQYHSQSGTLAEKSDARMQLVKTYLAENQNDAAANEVMDAENQPDHPLWLAKTLFIKSQVLLQKRTYQDALLTARQAKELAMEQEGSYALHLSLNASYQQARISTMLALQDRNKIENLVTAQKYYQECKVLLTRLLHYQLTPYDLNRLNTLKRDIFERAIENAYELFHQTQQSDQLDLIFTLMEESKAIGQFIQLSKYTNYGQTVSLAKLKAEAEFLGGNKDFTLLKDIKRSDELANLSSQTVQLNVFRNYLADENRRLVAYFYGSESIYLLSVEGAVTPRAYRFPLGDGLDGDVRAFISLCSKSPKQFSADFLSAAFDNYKALSKRLSNKLLPFYNDNNADISILFITDGPLHFLPFEAISLNTDYASSFSSVEYLGNRVETTYNYSASNYYFQSSITESSGFYAYFPNLHNEDEALARTISHTPPKKVYGLQHLLPLAEKWSQSTGGASYSDTKYNEEEIRPASAFLLGTDLILNSNKKKEHPTSSDKLRQIINQIKPRVNLFLFPSLIQGEEAFNSWDILLSSDLVDGNLLINRWEATKSSQNEIIDSFLDGVFNQQSPSKVLYMVRKQYLKEVADQPLLSHPYYWSGYCFIGKPNTSVNADSHYNTLPYLIFAAVFCLILLAFWVRKK